MPSFLLAISVELLAVFAKGQPCARSRRSIAVWYLAPRTFKPHKGKKALLM